MKIGCETITWGIQVDNIVEILDLLEELGFHGVEFAQRFNLLGVENAETLQNLLQERNLSFLSLVGGTLDERIGFCDQQLPEYLYVEPWELDKVSVLFRRQLEINTSDN